MVKNKKVRDERLTRRYEPKRSNFGLRFVDRTLVEKKLIFLAYFEASRVIQ